jgi:hypothetical protein
VVFNESVLGGDGLCQLPKSVLPSQALMRQCKSQRRWAETFRAKSIEMQQTILDALDNGIAAREAYATQLDRIRALEAEVAALKAWDAEKQNYELKKAGDAAVAYMLKPEVRGTQPPHWLCPNCFAGGEKSFLNPVGAQAGRGWTFKCSNCNAQPACWLKPSWVDEKAAV